MIEMTPLQRMLLFCGLLVVGLFPGCGSVEDLSTAVETSTITASQTGNLPTTTPISPLPFTIEPHITSTLSIETVTVTSTRASLAISSGTTERISVTSDGRQAEAPGELPDASGPDISADGRFVVFSSRATNLVPDDTNGVDDVFVHDRQTGLTERVSVSNDGAQAVGSSFGSTISANGRFVAFQSFGLLVDGIAYDGIFVRDRQLGQTELVSVSSEGTPANGASHTARLSADGRFVVFVSEADNLVVNDTNNWLDIFIHDRETGLTELVNVSHNGEQSNGWSHFPNISGDGRFVAYISEADNLVPDDTNGHLADVFVYDRLTHEVERIHKDLPTSLARISANGQWVAFIANGLLFLHDRQAGTTEQIKFGTSSFDISADGRYLALTTSGDAQILTYDHQTGETVLSSVAADGTPAYGFAPSISADGCFVAFLSFANNLVPNDTNEGFDVFVNGTLHSCLAQIH